MNVIIPLLGTTAAAAAAYFAYNKVSRDRILDYQYKKIGDAAARLSVTSQQHVVTVLVLGFQNHGRSSFVNTMFRVLYKEEGPLKMRAETGPGTATKTGITHALRVLKVKNKLQKLYPKYLMNVIDTPCLSTSYDIDDKAIRSDASKLRSGRTVPECVILVMRAEECHTEGPAWDRLPSLVRIIREEGLQFVVVLTHKKEAQKATIDLRDLTRSVAMIAGTDFVRCIENYVVGHGDEANILYVSNNFDTHNQTLSIVRQCFEYVRQRRQMMSGNVKKGYGIADDDSATE